MNNGDNLDLCVQLLAAAYFATMDIKLCDKKRRVLPLVKLRVKKDSFL